MTEWQSAIIDDARSPAGSADGLIALPRAEVSARRVAFVMSALVLFLIAANFVAMFLQTRFADFSPGGYSARLFALDAEVNIPTLYSGVSLAYCSLLLFIIAIIYRRDSSYSYSRHWLALALIFAALAIDEMCAIHEILIALRPMLDTRGVFHFAWVIPGLVFVALVLSFYWRFLFSLPGRTRNLFILSGSMFVGGAIGMEMVSGHYVDTHGSSDPVHYTLLTTVEESLEMFGIVIFAYALLSHIATLVSETRLTVHFSR